ncbi:MAG: hypothetical protein JST55_00990 [Bacteroidetes bacterium]|nr:hypothetical protein [Bacteroidota bacterium]
MYENKNQKLISKAKFKSRVFRNARWFLMLLGSALFIGMLGYRILGGFSWVDSFTEACMILGGMGPVKDMDNSAVKIFAGIYAIFSGVAFLSGVTLLISPFWHRELHKFHLADDDTDKDTDDKDEKKKTASKSKK